MKGEKGEVTGRRQQARALARHLECHRMGLGRHQKLEFNEPRRILRRIAISRARSSWKLVIGNMAEGKLKTVEGR